MNNKFFNGVLWALLALLMIFSTSAGAVSVTTFAGVAGTPGSVDGATGVTCQVNHPRGAYYDSVINNYLAVCDTGNSTIRGITSNTNTVTLAGIAGTSGFTDGAAGVGLMNEPTGVTGCTFTSTFYYVVADTKNNAIRKILPTSGALTTLAGAATPGAINATGTAARFNSPTGICSDGTYIYVADTGNNLIRKITTAGVVTTLAGTGIAGYTNGTAGTNSSFYMPTGVCTDGTNVYVADSFNYCIRQVVIASGATTTLIGANGDGTSTGTVVYTYKQPFGVDIHSTTIYIADTWDSDIKSVIQTNSVGALYAGTDNLIGAKNGTAGGTSNTSSFYYPRGVCYGNSALYVIDTENSLIRVIQ